MYLQIISFALIGVLYFDRFQDHFIDYRPALGFDAFSIALLDKRAKAFKTFLGSSKVIFNKDDNGQLDFILEIYNRYSSIPNAKELEAVNMVSEQYASKAISYVLLGFTERFGYVIFRYRYRDKSVHEVKIAIRK